MSGEIVKYDNFMNSLSFKDFEQKDFDLLMALCARMRDLGEKTQVFEYDYLMDLTGWDKSQNVDLFHRTLKRMVAKLRQVGATADVTPDEFVSFNLFSTFKGNRKARTLTVRVNPDFTDILNNLTRDFTRFELKEYVSLDGRYTKQLYQQLRQRYRLKKHYWQVEIDELRQVLSIPDGYEVKDITRYVINSAVEAIKKCRGFAELDCEPVRSSRRGRAITGYKFTWTELDQIPGQMHIDDYADNFEDKPKKRRGRPRKNQIVQCEYGNMSELEKAVVAN